MEKSSSENQIGKLPSKESVHSLPDYSFKDKNVVIADKALEGSAPSIPVRPHRSELAASMPKDQFRQVVTVTHELIERRYDKMKKMSDVASKDVNINPFLMLAMAPAYNIFSPFEAAEYAQNAKMPHGDATAFGRFVEEKIFPIFGGGQPAEKIDAVKKGDKQRAKVWSSIDGELNVEGKRYLATYKSGPWTMNQSHAHEMTNCFPEIHQQTGCDIIIGITYGKKANLNNKPRMVENGTGSYVHTLIGQELWEFITGVENAHLSVFQAIKEAQKEFSIEHGGKTFFEEMIETRLQLSESFRKAFHIDGTVDDMWEQIFVGSF